MYLTSGYPITKHDNNSSELFTPRKSKICLLSLAATIEKPLKKVPRPKALVISSIFEEAKPAFTLFGEATNMATGALKNILSFLIGSCLYISYE